MDSNLLANYLGVLSSARTVSLISTDSSRSSSVCKLPDSVDYYFNKSLVLTIEARAFFIRIDIVFGPIITTIDGIDTISRMSMKINTIPCQEFFDNNYPLRAEARINVQVPIRGVEEIKMIKFLPDDEHVDDLDLKNATDVGMAIGFKDGSGMIFRDAYDRMGVYVSCLSKSKFSIELNEMNRVSGIKIVKVEPVKG